MKKSAITIIAVALLTLSGCQSSSVYSGDVYTADQAKQTQHVNSGIVLSVRPVKIQTNASNNSTNNIIGSLSGAVLGGFIGNTIGGGTGRQLAIAGGAIGGALIGGEVQNTVSLVDAVELEVRQANGSTIVVVQKSPADQFYVGQEVRLISKGGQQISVSPR